MSRDDLYGSLGRGCWLVTGWQTSFYSLCRKLLAMAGKKHKWKMQSNCIDMWLCQINSLVIKWLKVYEYQLSFQKCAKEVFHFTANDFRPGIGQGFADYLPPFLFLLCIFCKKPRISTKHFTWVADLDVTHFQSSPCEYSIGSTGKKTPNANKISYFD